MGVTLPGDLQAALLDYQGRSRQAANRMAAIQELIRRELADRFSSVGPMLSVAAERPIKGKHRTKNWDVALQYASRYQLAVSTKAIISNVSGTVPNRVDDALGECVNVHAHDPGMVLGYLFVMDRGGGQQKTRDGRLWLDIFADSLSSFSGRRSPQDGYELFEAAVLLEVDFSVNPPVFSFHPRLQTWDQFFDLLVNQVRSRNPVINRLMP